MLMTSGILTKGKKTWRRTASLTVQLGTRCCTLKNKVSGGVPGSILSQMYHSKHIMGLMGPVHTFLYAAYRY